MKRQQRGSAIITALFIMAIVSIAATAMTIRMQIAIRHTSLSTQSERLYQLAQGVPQWAQITLHNMAKQQKDKLPQTFQLKTPEGIIVQGTLTDLQARFNINNLKEEAPQTKTYGYKAAFIKLIRTVSPDTNLEEATRIANATQQWVRATPNPNNKPYAQERPPYQLAQQPFVSTSELRLVAGMTDKRYQQLQPYIAALPPDTAININTASIPVLMTLSPDLTQDQAKKIIEKRNSAQGFVSPNTFASLIEKEQWDISKKPRWTVRSQYFLSRAHLVQDNLQITLLDTLWRTKNHKNEPIIKLLAESRNVS